MTCTADLLARQLGVRGAWTGNQARRNALMAYGALDVPPDVVVLGSSRVEGGLHAPFIQGELASSQKLDVRVYELGLAGLRIEWVRHMLQTTLAEQPPSKLLVVAIEARFFATAQSVTQHGVSEDEVFGEWQADLPAPWIETLFGGLRDVYALPHRHSASFVADQEVRHANGGSEVAWMDKVKLERNRLVQRKALIKKRGLTEIPDAFADGSIQWDWPDANSRTMQAWRDVLDLAEALPCEVHFVRMPLAPGFDEQSMPTIYPLFMRDVVDVLRARGFAFEDLQGPGWNDHPEWFYSKTHLDIPGVIPVSRRLATEILAPRLLRQPGL